ncbi:MAG: aspartyl/asparaginyl beta-hydroxylase domain-containing protein [Flavobacteriaceae bacterium]
MEDFKSLEAHFDIIKGEYESIKDKMIDYPEDFLYKNGEWKVFPIFRWPLPFKTEQSEKLTPETLKLVEKYVPNHGSVAFSRLQANTEISPHIGFQGKYLRYHLGIDVPDGDCCLKCENKIYKWENRKSFIFDDRKVHEAWNKTEKDRVILIIDFIP